MLNGMGTCWTAPVLVLLAQTSLPAGGQIEVLRALEANRFYQVVEGTGVAEPIRVDRS